MVLVTVPSNLGCFCFARCHLHHYTLNEMLTYTICTMQSGQFAVAVAMDCLFIGFRMSCGLAAHFTTQLHQRQHLITHTPAHLVSLASGPLNCIKFWATKKTGYASFDCSAYHQPPVIWYR